MKKIRKVLAVTFRIKEEDIYENMTIEEVDTWDSLTHMELVANLECEFKIEFDGDEIAEMLSVGAIEKLVANKLGGE